MGLLEIVIVGSVIIFVIASFAKNMNRTEEQKEAAKAKPSMAVRGWNASGAPQVESTRVFPAVRELAGRGLGKLTGKAQKAAKERWDGREGRRNEKAEALADVREAALRRARQVTDAVSTRWDNHRPAWLPRRQRADGTDEAPEAATAVPDPSGRPPSSDPKDWPEVTASAPCSACGTTNTATIPAGEKVVDVTCTCGRQSYFFRRLTEDPVIEGSRPADVVAPEAPPAETPILTLVPKENDMTATTTDTAAPASTEGTWSPQAPADWRTVANRVAEFEPESDSDLINFMSSEIAGMCSYSESYEALFETCTKSLGLDQRSVQGLGEFGEKVVDLTREMALAHRRFVEVYAEVMKFVGDGGVMPHDGRFFDGNLAV